MSERKYGSLRVHGVKQDEWSSLPAKYYSQSLEAIAPHTWADLLGNMASMDTVKGIVDQENVLFLAHDTQHGLLAEAAGLREDPKVYFALLKSKEFTLITIDSGYMRDSDSSAALLLADNIDQGIKSDRDSIDLSLYGETGSPIFVGKLNSFKFDIGNSS